MGHTETPLWRLHLFSMYVLHYKTLKKKVFIVFVCVGIAVPSGVHVQHI